MKSTCMRCSDGTLLEQFRTQLAEVTQERDRMREAAEQARNILFELIDAWPQGTSLKTSLVVLAAHSALSAPPESKPYGTVGEKP